MRNVGRNFNVGEAARAVVIGDFNNDSKEDLAVANFNGDTISVLVATPEPTSILGFLLLGLLGITVKLRKK